MRDVAVESTRFSPLRVGAGSLVVAAHAAALLALSLAAPSGFELPLKKAVADAIEVVIVPVLRPLPPPPMPSAPVRHHDRRVLVPEVPVAMPSELPVPAEVVSEALVATAADFSDVTAGASDAAGAASGAGVLTVLRGSPPPYPARARRRGLQGEVLLRIAIDADGWPHEVTVVRSSGHRELDRAAQRHVLGNWRFSPPGVAAAGELPVRFSLH